MTDTPQSTLKSGRLGVFGTRQADRCRDNRDAGFGDYVQLLKPRVMSLVVFTALVGLLVAPVSLHPVEVFTAVLFIALGGGASGALNMWWDADIDAIMRRTKSRPIPSGRIEAGEALAVGLALSGISVVMLALATNVLAGALLAFTIFFYVVIYSVWLKRSTPQNIVIGGAAGAFPPLVGWASVNGTLAVAVTELQTVCAEKNARTPIVWSPPRTGTASAACGPRCSSTRTPA